ncbi:MAG: EamA family transporter, partial [Rhodocyclaceae bacterium]|nr:EamA family transporter [Rhodocyclaceae bacterium]
MDQKKTLTGIACGLAAYGMWGFFPLFFRQIGHVAPADLLCNRAFWGCVFVSAVLTLRRQWALPLTAARRSGFLLRLFVAALLVGLNWLVFLWAVDQHYVIAASLGYFLTPLVNVLLGMLVLKERLNGKEWAS